MRIERPCWMPSRPFRSVSAVSWGSWCQGGVESICSFRSSVTHRELWPWRREPVFFPGMCQPGKAVHGCPRNRPDLWPRHEAPNANRSLARTCQLCLTGPLARGAFRTALAWTPALRHSSPRWMVRRRMPEGQSPRLKIREQHRDEAHRRR